MRAIDIFSESFIHRRIFGAAKGLVTGGFGGAVGGFLTGGGASIDVSSIPDSVVPGRSFGGQGPCVGPLARDAAGNCVFPGSPGALSTGTGVGTSVAVVRPGGVDGQLPSARSSRTLICPPGMVLSKDDRCFHSLSRKERKWDPGRKPLLTGGERNAITKAAAAARKIQRTEKQLQKLGMLKKPTSRRAPRRHAHPTHELSSSDPGVRIISVGE